MTHDGKRTPSGPQETLTDNEKRLLRPIPNEKLVVARWASRLLRDPDWREFLTKKGSLELPFGVTVNVPASADFHIGTNEGDDG